MATLSFDATQVQPQAAFEPLKSGWYVAQITDSDLVQTRAGDGHYLKLELTLIGDHNGEKSNARKVWTNLNIDNKNEVAVKIAQEQLSAICHAIGRLQVGDSAELHGQPLMVRLKVRPATDNYDASNDVSGFKAVEGAVGAGTGVAPPAGTVAPPVAQPSVQQPQVAPGGVVAPPATVAAPVAAPVAQPTVPATGVPGWAAGGNQPG